MAKRYRVGGLVGRVAAGAALLLAASLIGAWNYNPNDYRKGEIAHWWPKHGVWQVLLRSGGGDGTGKCVLGMQAGAQEPTFMLFFTDDGQMLWVGWADTNFAATNSENFDSRERMYENLQGMPNPLGPSNEASLAVGDQRFFHTQPTRIPGRLSGLRFVIVKPVFLSWQSPNRDSKSTFSNDGPNAPSSDQILDLMAKGHTLDFQDGAYHRSIPLSGFADAAKDMRTCLYALAG
ncbi:MAG: hypothetical protein ACREFU_03325 [Acetobacteraceae bacterium]